MKGQKINNEKAHKSTTNKKELNKKLVTDDSLNKQLREELEEDIYDRGNSSFTSESRLSSKYENEEEFWLVESDEEIMSSKEELKQNTSDQLTTKQQLLKTFIDKGYSIYKIDKEKLIDSASKSNLYFLKRKLSENWSFERRTGSGRNKKFDSEIGQRIVDLVRENQFISIKEITSNLRKISRLLLRTEQYIIFWKKMVTLMSLLNLHQKQMKK